MMLSILTTCCLVSLLELLCCVNIYGILYRLKAYRKNVVAKCVSIFFFFYSNACKPKSLITVMYLSFLRNPMKTYFACASKRQWNVNRHS